MTNTQQSNASPDWRAMDRQHHLHPFTDLKAYAESGGRVISHTDHIYIYDTDGHEILDSMSDFRVAG